MFSDTVQLSALTTLVTVYGMTWEAPDLDCLVSSCSALQELSLCCSPGLQLTALLQLTAMSYLWLADVTEDNTVASLVQLSALQGLQKVTITEPCNFTDDDAVQSLTALTQLTTLELTAGEGAFSAAMQQQLLLQFHTFHMLCECCMTSSDCNDEAVALQ